MKFKVTTMAVVLMAITASVSMAAIRYVDPAGSDGAGFVYGVTAGANDCLTGGGSSCATIWQALAVADQGDTILLAASLTPYAEGEIVIDKKFITISGPVGWAVVMPGTGGRLTECAGSEACIDASGYDYAFSIEEDNVTIEALSIMGDDDTYALIQIPGPYDRWEVGYNFLYEAGAKKSGALPNYSYGIYGDAQTTSGTDTMTGNEIHYNLMFELGRNAALAGSNETAGSGVHLEGIEGESSECTTLDKFDCGVWIHDNKFEDLAVGQNVLNFAFDVNGTEFSTAINIVQDEENSLPNNGALIEDNEYDDDAVDGDLLSNGIIIGIGDSQVIEDNASMLADVVAYVTNIDRKATIDELLLADFYKTLYPTFYGPGSDIYFEDESEAKDFSDDTATIVHLEELVAAEQDLFRISVEAQGNSASYKLSLDSDGDLNLRQGARLLFDGLLSSNPTDTVDPDFDHNGVSEIVLNGTDGDDLFTVDFNNGNPIPGADPGVDFNGLGGFDKIVLRGDEQVTDETLLMTGPDSGVIYFEPTASAGLAPHDFTGGTTTSIDFEDLEPIDDLIIVNGIYSVIAPDDTNNEINIINGPFRFGFDTFQINSGQNATFEEINFSNKKNVHVYGADNTVPGDTDADDVITVFTEDGDAPDLFLSLYLYGGNAAAGADASDDYFVVRPSADFPIYVSGGTDYTDDYIFLDCAKTHSSCDPFVIGANPVGTTDTGGSITGFEDVHWTGVEETAELLLEDLVIRKELIGFAADGAHPGDEISYRVTIRNDDVTDMDMTDDPVWITDVIDHRLSLVEQSVVVESGTVQVAGSNTAMLWHIDDVVALAPGDSLSMTYTVIVNTLITTDDIHNYASILNGDPDPIDQWVDNGGDTLEHFGHVDLDVLDVFGFPVKAAIQASLFYETEAGPRYMVGLYGGAKDPATGNIGSMLCRVPDTNQEVGWDGGLGNLWYSCGEGLPNTDNLFLPLVVTDLFQDSAGRIWLTSWGFDGLYFSDDGGQTWESALADLSGGQGGSPDGIPDGFAQIYAITEDILGTLYISANNGDVYRSFDRAVTWQKSKQLPLGSADTAYSLEADPTVPGKVYAGTFGDSLYVTNDFAETWQRPDGIGLGNGYIFDIELDPISGNLFVGTAKGIYYSSDEGDNWTGLNSAFPFPTNPPEIRNMAFDENGALFASTWGQGVWSSLDWQAFSLELFALKTANVLDMSVSNGYVYVLSENGATSKVKYTSFARSVDVDPEAELPSTFTLDQNYPNPFNPTTSIQFNLPVSQQVNLSVFDVLGRRVAVLVNDQLTAGQHQVSFQAASLPSGMYLYRLSTPTGAITQKMILLK